MELKWIWNESCYLKLIKNLTFKYLLLLFYFISYSLLMIYRIIMYQLCINYVHWNFITCCILCNGAARSRRLPGGNNWTSPLVTTLPSFEAASSKIRAPFTTRPAIIPKNGLSTLPLLRFHRPPIWMVDWLLNTVNWRPANRSKHYY